jgi:hypothetical protein
MILGESNSIRRALPRRIAAVTCAALAATAGAASDVTSDVVEWSTVGGWEIGYYPESNGCHAFALFEGYTAFFIGFDGTEGTKSLDVTLIDQSWTQVIAGQEHEILVRFGDNPAWTLPMNGSLADGFPALHIHIKAESPEARQFIGQFQRESQMEWLLNGDALARLTLSGSKRAFEEVTACDAADHSPENRQVTVQASPPPAPF